MPPCDRPRPGVDITRGGGGDASESARGDSALLGTRKRSKFPFASRKCRCLGPFLGVFRFPLAATRRAERAGLTARGAFGSIGLAHTPADPQRPVRHRAANPARRHTRGSGSRDGGGQTGRGRARRRGRGGCAERTRRVHRAELHERRAREGCDRGASRETAPNASARSRRAIGVSPRRRASSRARNSSLDLELDSTRTRARRRERFTPSRRVVRGDVRFSRRSKIFAIFEAALTDTSRDSPSTRPTHVTFLRAM